MVLSGVGCAGMDLGMGPWGWFGGTGAGGVSSAGGG